MHPKNRSKAKGIYKVSRRAYRARPPVPMVLTAVLLGAAALLVSCQSDEPQKSAPVTSPPDVAHPTPPPATPKEVPDDIVAFVTWAAQAGSAIQAGPKTTDNHPVLGRITCRKDKTFDDFGYCASSKEGTPRYAAQWPKNDPNVWSVSMMRYPNAAWVDCQAIGKAPIRNSKEPKIIMHRCKYAETEDLWLRHFVPPGATGNTQVYVFSRDFPKADATPRLSPRPTLYRDLARGN